MLATMSPTSYAIPPKINHHVAEDQDSYQGRKKKRLFSQLADRELMDLKIDYAFKQLFDNEQNKNITRAFLNGFLHQSGRAPAKEIIFKNVEIGGEYEYDKESRMDLLIETENQEKINIEIQFTNQYNMIKRTLYYWARLYSQPLAKAQDYSTLTYLSRSRPFSTGG
ncbi:Rpn family recombination-promoting nuclease/putative transposase [Amphibacillus sp. Q70]|uniref:Rpn family recombination-promoting nuclease/putative transposase n=1 Tax=Amphibacillus sp. Q70 TaxID=3453416 RepID=UPI003F87C0A1